LEDNRIIELFWQRQETALTETRKKYGAYCFRIAYNILKNSEDSEECVNDTYLHAWQAIPPKRPEHFAAFLGKITRNIALQRFIRYNAAKRNGSETALALEELRESALPTGEIETERIAEASEINRALADFLGGLTKEARVVFVLRYWHLYSVADIAARCCMSESKVKSMLFRARKKLKEHLEKEGIDL